MNLDKILVVIPARGGSKGIPGKNIKPLAGKPLIYYTIEAARKVFPDNQILVSTDDITIKECVEKTGLLVPFLRPAELATDNAGTYEVLLHALNYVETQGFRPELLLLLQPTTPFRSAYHIRKALQLVDEKTEMVVSVKETGSNPYYVLFEENEQGWLEKSKKGKFSNRQSCPKVWEYNGGIYVIKIKDLKNKHLNEFVNVRKYVMDEYASIDIDRPIDWELAEVIIKKLDLFNNEA